jgi:hypothetical protein
MNLVIFDDYISSDDYPNNLTALLGELGTRLGLPRVPDEVGVVCPNVLTAANNLVERYGAGPFLLGEGSPKDFDEGGTIKPFTTRIGFGYYRDVLIELAEPGLGSEFFGKALDPAGRITLHHLGFFARGDALSREDRDGNPAQFTARLRGAGYEPAVTTRLSAVGAVGNVTVFSTDKETNGIGTEFLDIRLFGRHGIPFGLPQWLVKLIANFQIGTGCRFLKLPAAHKLPPAPRG